MIRKDNVLEVEHLGGGKGTAYVHHIVSKEELLGHGRLYAKVVLPPGASVGWHQHVHDTEPYYILKGEADFIDNDKSVTKVGLVTAVLLKWDSITALRIILTLM